MHTEYLREIVRRLRDLLGGPLAGVYLTGSMAYGAYVPGRSDLDVFAVLERPCPPARLRAVASACSHRMLACPARRLELVLYPLEAVRSEPPSLDWVLNLETGAAEERVSFEPSSEPRHWFVLDASIARDHARAILGPPADRVFAPLDRARVVGALRDSISWHREHEPGSANAVLNACRGWARVRAGAWMSKPDAARWAAGRTPHASLVRSALALHGGASREPLRPGAVAAFLADVERDIGLAER